LIRFLASALSSVHGSHSREVLVGLVWNLVFKTV